MQIYTVDCYLATGTVVHVLLNKDQSFVGSYMYKRLINTVPLFVHPSKDYGTSIISTIFDRIQYSIYLNTIEKCGDTDDLGWGMTVNACKPRYSILSKLNTFKRITINEWLKSNNHDITPYL